MSAQISTQMELSYTDDPRTSCRFDDAEFRLKFGFNFRGLLVDESQLPAAVLSEIAFTVRSLAFTDYIL